MIFIKKLNYYRLNQDQKRESTTTGVNQSQIISSDQKRQNSILRDSINNRSFEQIEIKEKREKLKGLGT